MKKTTLITLIIMIYSAVSYGQCADINNIYSFTYDNKTYEIVKENKNWTDASACAVERGGILTEINDSAEQIAIFTELNTNAGIILSNTTALDGGSASYVWIGGNDLSSEGVWVWDGNNDNASTQFWAGTFASGNPVGGLYNNWGNEPDDFGPGQDALGLALTNWPLGTLGQWNDLRDIDELYYVIEHSALGIKKFDLNNSIKIYPNPASKEINIVNNLSLKVESVKIFNLIGQKITRNLISENNSSIDISHLQKGIYFLEIQLENNAVSFKKFIKN